MLLLPITIQVNQMTIQSSELLPTFVNFISSTDIDVKNVISQLINTHLQEMVQEKNTS
jgi:hypothetical protein